MNFTKRTKILATLGPASDSEKKLTELIQAGVNIFRINFSHSSHENAGKTIQKIRKVEKELNTVVGILADLQGPKFRCGLIDTTLVKGQKVRISCDKSIVDNASKTSPTKIDDIIVIPTPNEPLVTALDVDQRVLFDDGRIQVKILKRINPSNLECVVTVPGHLTSRKGMNVPDSTIPVPALTEKDLKDLEYIVTQDFNFIALSFVQRASDLIQLRKLIGKNQTFSIVSKIEKPQAITDLDAILEQTDVIMLARGDLGIELSLEQVPTVSKMIIHKCVSLGIPVITATQMLESMISSPIPTRAEVTDVATAVYDGCSAVMLSGETSVGKFPVKTVEMMTKICIEVEKSKPSETLHYPDISDVTEAVAFSLVHSSSITKAKAICVYTLTGSMINKISRYRPNVPVIACTPRSDTFRQLTVSYGIYPYFMNSYAPDTEHLLLSLEKCVVSNLKCQNGDIVIYGSGKTHLDSGSLYSMPRAVGESARREKIMNVWKKAAAYVLHEKAQSSSEDTS